VTLLEEIADSGRPAMARKVHAYLTKLFNWAIARGTLETSPCTAVKPAALIGRQEARQRVLNDAEIRALWEAAGTLGYPHAQFIKMLLLCGQRLRETANAQWQEFNLDAGLWTIPPERMKTGVAHEVPLPTAAVELLKSLPHWSGPFVFSTRGGGRPIAGFSQVKNRIDAALGDKVAAWRFHDLRRTMRTGLGALPIPSNVCEMCIAHAQPGMRRVYDRYGYRSEKARALSLWAARLAEIVEPGRDPGNVVPLRA
jgi:integrase